MNCSMHKKLLLSSILFGFFNSFWILMVCLSLGTPVNEWRVDLVNDWLGGYGRRSGKKFFNRSEKDEREMTY